MIHTPSSIGSILPTILDYLSDGVKMQDSSAVWNTKNCIASYWMDRSLVNILFECISNGPFHNRNRKMEYLQRDMKAMWKHMRLYIPFLCNRCRLLASNEQSTEYTKNSFWSRDLHQVAYVLISYIKFDYQAHDSSSTTRIMLHCGCVRSLVVLFQRVFSCSGRIMQRCSFWRKPQDLLLLCAGLSREVCSFVVNNLKCQGIIESSEFRNECGSAAILWFCYAKVHQTEAASLWWNHDYMKSASRFTDLLQRFEPSATSSGDELIPSKWNLDLDKAEIILEVLFGLKYIRPSLISDQLPELVSKVAKLQVQFRKGQIEIRSKKQGNRMRNAAVMADVRTIVKEFQESMLPLTCGSGKSD